MADPRILSGIVDPFGKPFSGTGFRVEVVDTGLYTVLFDTAFNVYPAVTASQIHPWPMTADSEGGNTKDNAVIVNISPDRTRIKVGDKDGIPVNRAFAFIAVG